METMRFNCELCGARIEAPVSLRGQRVVCPLCNGLVVVPYVIGGPTPRTPAVRRTSPAGPASAPLVPKGPGVPAGGTVGTLMHVPPRSGGPLESTRVRVAGWALSVLLHALLIVLFMAVTWVAGGGGGVARGSDVDMSVTDSPVTMEEKAHEPLQLDIP
ncbi:MAG TPA: hypothetical protein VMY39_07925, partial [Planctomycetota bacterium]|nr:hypothetical protein [Planctomycetota bacterium]